VNTDKAERGRERYITRMALQGIAKQGIAGQSRADYFGRKKW